MKIMEVPSQPKTLLNHRISISGLNLLAWNPIDYKRRIEDPEQIDARHFRIGSAVDYVLTGSESFYNKYRLVVHQRPAAMMGEFVDRLLELVKDRGIHDISVEDWEIYYLDAYDKTGYKTKVETVVKNFENKPEIQGYFNEQLMADERLPISAEEDLIVSRIVNALQTGELTKKWIVDMPADPQVDTYDQLEIAWKYRGYSAVSHLDKVLVNHTAKMIHPMDLKTTGKSAYSFHQSVIKYGYFRQAAFYMRALESWKLKEERIKDYKIDNFRFIVAETGCYTPPLVYKCTSNDITVGLHGGYLKGSVRYIKGVCDLIEDLKWHQHNSKWDIRREVALARVDGVELDLFDERSTYSSVPLEAE
jgi:hypothetical protein